LCLSEMQAQALPSPAINKMTAKHTPESPFTHWTCTNDELISRVSAAWAQRTSGDVEGSFIVPIDAAGIFTPIVELFEGDKLVGLFAPRFSQDEDPRLSVFVLRDEFVKLPAASCNVIVYMSAALGDHASTDADAEIISVNGETSGPKQDDADAEPIMPTAFIANQLDLSGGSPTTLTIEEFKPKFDHVARYWARHAQLAFPGPKYIDLGTYKPGDLHLDGSQSVPLQLALAGNGLKLETVGVNYIIENCG